MSCPACGATVPEAARFCPECGNRLVVAPDERRLVTVLMADLVGFTSLSEAADPEHVKRLVDRCVERLVVDLVAFGGRLDKVVGDEIVAQFGAPVAHEDDAERAVRAALQMHETLARLSSELGVPVQMRIGVNTGEVLVGSLAHGGETTVMGDVVNIASRLQTSAEPGQVVVGPATYAATRDAIRYRPLGALPVKGREVPVEAFAAIAAAAPPGGRTVRHRAPLVGRDDELGALLHALRVTARRSRAHFVLLQGDAGVGKSRLATELSAAAGTEFGARTLVGHCAPYGDSNVFAPYAEALRHACGVEPLESAKASAPKIATAVASTLALPVESGEVERIVEGLLYVMDGVARAGVDPARARDDAMRSTITFFEGLAATAPLVLVLSDMHWAEDPVLELCDRLLERLRNRPVVLLATARTGFDARWQPKPRFHNALFLNLDPLDARATAALVEALSGDGVDDDTVTFVLERSGGNPFFVEELVAYLRESEPGDSARAEPAGERLQRLPATLHGLVAARLDALAPAERSLLEDCAVVGSSGPVEAVVALSHSPDAQRVLERLADRDLLVVDGEDFHFKSELIREIAYGTLTKAERARRHATLASVLEQHADLAADQIADHLATAAEIVEELGAVPGVGSDVRERAIAALAHAAARAEAVESWLVAGRHHERALTLLASDDGEARRNALLGRARSRAAQREVDGARGDVEIVLAEAREAHDGRGVASALTLQADLYSFAGEYDLAEITYNEAVSEWRAVGDSSGAAGALRGLGMTHLFRGETAEAERLIVEALAAFRTDGDRRGEAWALQNLAMISFMRGQIRDSEDRLHRSADLFAELGDWGGLGWALGLLAFVRYNQGRLDEAAELAEQMLAESTETGNRWAVGMMEVLLANIAMWRGITSESARRGAQARALFREIGDRWGETQAGGPLARSLATLGRDDEYERALADLQAAASFLPDDMMRRLPAIVEAEVAIERGVPDVALQLLQEHWHENDDVAGAADSHGALALATLQSGRPDDAVRHLEPVYAAATADGARYAIGSRLALAYAAAGRTGDALRVASELVPLEGGTYADRVLRLCAEGVARLRSGAPDAREPFDAAYEIVLATEAVVQQAVAALVRATALTKLGEPDAEEGRRDADERIRALGIDPVGWTRIFGDA
jgi:class 3 adenylate cyclase/tetratricopeptide (TPR) repeat protein